MAIKDLTGLHVHVPGGFTFMFLEARKPGFTCLKPSRTFSQYSVRARKENVKFCPE